MSQSSAKILMLLPVVGQPRFAKRIDMLHEQGHQIEVASFKRDYHSGRLPTCPVTYLGKIQNERYLARIPVLLKSIASLRRLIKNSDVTYAVGTDLVLLTIIARIGLRQGLVLETGDVRKIQTSQSISGKTIRMLDRFICSKINFVVVTAPAFLENYYRKWLGTSVPGHLVENKLETSHAQEIKNILSKEVSDSEPRVLTIGYFGLLPSRWSWRVLRALAETYPDKVRVIFAGHPRDLTAFQSVVGELDNIEYWGRYQSPADLPKLYRSVDLSWGCTSPFDPNDWNLRWLRSNRYYEACAFETPLISRAESDEASEVERLDIGFVLGETDVARAVEKLISITAEDIERWKSNMSELPPHVYSYTDEAEKLSESINLAADNR